jgi:hypothetical protein
MEPEGSIPCSQKPSTGPYPEPYHLFITVKKNIKLLLLLLAYFFLARMLVLLADFVYTRIVAYNSNIFTIAMYVIVNL